MPFADLLNHAAPNNAHIESNDVDCVGGPEDHARKILSFSTVDVCAAEDIDAGEEVTNSYGELGNAELLCQYGFVLDTKTGWERCSWDARLPREREELCKYLGCEAAAFENAAAYEPLEADVQRASDDGLPPAYVDVHGEYDFAPVSYANRHDRQCPLFIDAAGRASWPLWRVALGLRTKHVHAQDLGAFPCTRLARQRIMRLCEQRLQQISAADDALHTPTRFAAQLAWQEEDMLRACVARYGTT